LTPIALNASDPPTGSLAKIISKRGKRERLGWGTPLNTLQN